LSRRLGGPQRGYERLEKRKYFLVVVNESECALVCFTSALLSKCRDYTSIMPRPLTWLLLLFQLSTHIQELSCCFSSARTFKNSLVVLAQHAHSRTLLLFQFSTHIQELSCFSSARTFKNSLVVSAQHAHSRTLLLF